MKLKDIYKKNILEIIEKISTQEEHIEKASQLIQNTLEKKGIIYITGSGHSHMIAEEIFYRAGGLVAVCPILEDSLMLHKSAVRSTEMERIEGLADVILNDIHFKEDCDILIIISNSGRNAYPIEAALHAKKKHIKTIAISSLEHSKRVSSRHTSGKRLFEIADVILDNGGVYGDAGVTVPHINAKMGASSTIAGVFLMHSVILGAVENLIEKGIFPDIFESANIENNNTKVLDILAWKSRIRIL